MQHRKCLCVMHHTTWQQGRYEGKRIENVSRLMFDAFHLDKNDKYFITFSKRTHPIANTHIHATHCVVILVR